MKIAILSAADVSGYYAATLIERGHQITIGPFGHVPTAVDTLVKDKIDGLLMLTEDDANLEEIATLFSRVTGKPVWRNLTEVPR